MDNQMRFPPIPSNIIIKSIYNNNTRPLLEPKYIQTITNKVIAYLQENPKNPNKLEIEAKFGTFSFIGDCIKCYSQITDPFVIPEFKGSEYRYDFGARVTPRKFYLIWGALEKEYQIPESGIQFLGCFTIKETHYKNFKRHGIIYQNGKPIREDTIIKENKKNINIRNNGNDFRITCCKEMNTEIKEAFDLVDSHRDKFRVSYHFSFYRVDLTIVKDEKFPDYDYQIEIEIDKLGETIEKEGKNVNYMNVSSILNRFVQNILNLYSVISNNALYDNFNEIKQREYLYGINKHYMPQEINSIYGNYFQNNLLHSDEDNMDKNKEL